MTVPLESVAPRAIVRRTPGLVICGLAPAGKIGFI
jgi:hypothetical protein